MSDCPGSWNTRDTRVPSPHGSPFAPPVMTSHTPNWRYPRHLSAAAAAQGVKIKSKSSFEFYTKSILSGGLAGGIEICITMPTEYVKTQLQLAKTGKTAYTGITDCVRKTVSEYGVRGLYRGLSSMVFFAIPKSAVRFCAYDAASKRVSGGTGKISGTQALACGLVAGVTEAIFVVTPQETVKTKLISDRNRPTPKYKGLFQGMRAIAAEEGARGLYKGLVPTIAKQGSNQAVRFYVMFYLNDWYRGGNDNKAIPFYFTFVNGFIAGACSVFANTPIDVVKTRMQGVDAHKYNGVVDCIKSVYRDGGLRGFYKGTVPRLGRVCLDVAIVFTIKEEVIRFLNFVW